MFLHEDQLELKELFNLKELGKLKPLSEIKRDELKYVIEVEFATVEQLSELFNVSKGKIQDFKRIKRLRDSDLQFERKLDEKADFANYIYSVVKTKINDEIDKTIAEDKELFSKEDIEKLGENLKLNIVSFMEEIENAFYSKKEETLYKHEKSDGN